MKNNKTRFVSVAVLALLGATSISFSQTLTTEGPAPFEGGQSEALNSDQVGAVNAIAAHPTDANILYLGSVNGGVWKTTNAMDVGSSPSWSPQTDDKGSLSIQTLEFDPTDQTHETLVAGIGRVSSFARLGGDRTGLLRTTDGGTNWTALSSLAGRNIAGVAPRGSVIVAAVNATDSGDPCANTGIFRSTDTGASFTQVTNGISGGLVDALASDPSDPSILYASLQGDVDSCSSDIGIYKSTDTGVSWSKVSDAAIDALFSDTSSLHVEIAVGNNDNVFVGIALGRLTGVFYSANGGTSFTSMELPGTLEPDDFFGIHPGGQASIHMSMEVDPAVDHVVYIGGDRQPASNNDGSTGPFAFPNSLGANTFSGRLFRGDATAQPGSQWVSLTHSGTANNTAPHADSRDMMFAANGLLIEGDDGGVYVRTSPIDDTGDWSSLNGDIQNTEVHSADYDDNAEVIGGGTQDNSQGSQLVSAFPQWEVYLGGDGGDFDVDTQTLAGNNQSIRYTSAQNIAAFTRRVYNQNNTVASVSFPPLTVVSGNTNKIPQFVTPVDINMVDANRMVIGYRNSVYESFDQGNTLNELSPSGIAAFGFGFDSIAAGAPGNVEQLYIAADTDLYRRTTAGGDLTSVFSSANRIFAVSQSQTDASKAALIEWFGGVHVTSDTGDSWTDVTGNLNSFDPGRINSVEYASNFFVNDDMLVVGTDRGVFVASEATGFTVWAPLNADLPNAMVFGLNYDAEINELFINTLGRGTFSFEPLFEIIDLIFADGFDGP